jgi:hypothetical protein
MPHHPLNTPNFRQNTRVQPFNSPAPAAPNFLSAARHKKTALQVQIPAKTEKLRSITKKIFAATASLLISLSKRENIQ